VAEGHAHAEFHLNEAALSRAILPILVKKGNSLARRGANQARTDVPVRSGNLGRTIGIDLATPTGPFSVSAGVHAGGRGAPYAIPVHEGSRRHVIRARRAPMLRFFWEKVGRNVAFRSVHHPGVAARPFLRNAMIRAAATDPDVTPG
jgi:hypothetical protein